MKMNSEKMLALCAVAAGVAFSTGAQAQEIRVWRGETTVERLRDATEIGKLPMGIGVRLGELRSVKAAPEPNGLSRVDVYDRVVWTAHPKGVRVIEVSASPHAKPGVYACGDMLTVRVLDRVLPPPSQWKYYLDLWQHPWAVARLAKAEPFSLRHYEAMRPLWKLLATAGQKTLTVTLVDQPWNHQCRDAYHSMIGRTRHADGSWSFDYRIFDEYVAFGRSCGLGPDIACYTLCPWGFACRYRQDGVGEVVANGVPGTPAFDEFWGAFLDDFARHLKEKGWFKDVLIAMDEREPKDVKLVADFVQKHAPGMRISMAGNRKPSDFKGITIDSYAQILFSDCVTPAFLAEAAERHAHGLKTTFYVCCGPRHPNTLLESRDGEAFWCGAFPAMAGLDGFLRWAYNSWPEDPMSDATYGDWLAGDTYLAYPDGAPSWRFVELRRGIVAAEKVRLLREQGLFGTEIDAIAKRFIVKEANESKTDFVKLRQDVQTLVNK